MERGAWEDLEARKGREKCNYLLKGKSHFYSSSELVTSSIEHLSLVLSPRERISHVLPSGRTLHLQDGLGKKIKKIKLKSTNNPPKHATPKTEKTAQICKITGLSFQQQE